MSITKVGAVGDVAGEKGIWACGLSSIPGSLVLRAVGSQGRSAYSSNLLRCVF